MLIKAANKSRPVASGLGVGALFGFKFHHVRAWENMHVRLQLQLASTTRAHSLVMSAMETHQHTLKVPPELLDHIFEHLMDPYNPLIRHSSPPGFGDEAKGMVALANCAQACRAFLRPALKVLWKSRH